jgi:hypothetical protein
MTLAELDWIKKRRAVCLPPQKEPEPQRNPEPDHAPIDTERFTLDLYGELIARMEMAT